MCFVRITEEVFPFIYYLLRVNKKKKIYNLDEKKFGEIFPGYGNLPEDILIERIKDERQRASNLDEKTYKLTLSLSFGLSVVSFAATALPKSISLIYAQISIYIVIWLGLFYFMIAGFVALGSLKTSQSFGYGTDFSLKLENNNERKQIILAEALAKQETANIIRHLRNETAYQTLRNGLVLLFLAIISFVGILAYQYITLP